MKNVILKVENISKQYRLGTVSTGALSHDLNRFWHRIRGKEDPYLKIGAVNDRSKAAEGDYAWALKDINFEVAQGEVLGIIGKNGAGKSTLLKILSRVTSPTTGEIKTKGRIASLLEVGTGFHPELTGRENIYLNGAILGMSKSEIADKIDEIIDFSGCQMYIDTPTKRYSSGMTVRLAFAVAAHLEPDILIVDEVLAVGDAEFQKKAIGKMQDISKGEGRTVLFVSHNMGTIKKLCGRGILLENGEIKIMDTISKVLDAYQSIELEGNDYFAKPSTKDYYISSVKILEDRIAYYNTDTIVVEIKATAINLKVDSVKLLLRLLHGSDEVIFSLEKPLIKDKTIFNFQIPANFLVKGNYKINCILYHPAVAVYDTIEECCAFEIIDNNAKFSHLETFDTGKIYVSDTWLQYKYDD